MQSAQDNHAFEMSLRDQLIAAQNGQPPPAPQPAVQAPRRYPSLPQQLPHEHPHQVDPNLGRQHISPYSMPPAEDTDDKSGESPGSKKTPKQRELSQTKRAAQNRAAQRAFRQRKEQYIGQLEEDIEKYKGLEEDFKTLQEDNTALRHYIINLQGMLSEAKIDFPPAPATARVAQPNPVVYDLSEHSPEATDYPTQASPPSRQFYADVRHYQDPPQQGAAHHAGPGHSEAQPTSTDYSHVQAPPPSMPAGEEEDDALPPGAITRLRAAAVQAGDQLDDARATRSLPDEYAPANDQPPQKRQRLEEESRGTAGAVIAALVAKFTSIAGSKAQAQG